MLSAGGDVLEGMDTNTDPTTTPDTDSTATMAMCVLFGRLRGRLYVLLMQRGPHISQSGMWSAPGGHMQSTGPAADAAARECFAQTQVYVTGPELTTIPPTTDPSGRRVFTGFLQDMQEPISGGGASLAAWIPVENLTQFRDLLAEGHYDIVTSCRDTLGLFIG